LSFFPIRWSIRNTLIRAAVERPVERGDASGGGGIRIYLR